MTSEPEKDVERVIRWLEQIADIDLSEITADGGVTSGMVVQQEARTVIVPRLKSVLSRLSSPVSGTDGYMMVPREPTEAMVAAWENACPKAGWQALQDMSDADANAALVHAEWSAMLSASPTPPIPMIAEAGERDVERHLSHETVCGFKVAAYRETHPEHGAKYGHSYSEHWSTPNTRHPDVKVERLFTEAQLRAALSTPATLDNTAVEVETGPPCVGCGKPVAVGQVVLCYDDAGEVHADCERPYRLVHRRKADDPDAMVLLGSPMVHVPLATLTAKTEKAR